MIFMFQPTHGQTMAAVVTGGISLPAVVTGCLAVTSKLEMITLKKPFIRQISIVIRFGLAALSPYFTILTINSLEHQ